MSKIRWMYYPNDQKPNNQIIKTIEVFEKNHDLYDSDNHTLTSNEVLNVLTKDLQKIGYQVETDKKIKLIYPYYMEKMVKYLNHLMLTDMNQI